jgi:hypothetical protein
MTTKTKKKYPTAVEPDAVGEYAAVSGSGGGYFYDAVLEYRVWIHPKRCSDFYHAFATFKKAYKFANESRATNKFAVVEEPLVLVGQIEHINEVEPGKFELVTTPRITEWKPDWLANSKRTARKVSQFLKTGKKAA